MESTIFQLAKIVQFPVENVDFIATVFCLGLKIATIIIIRQLMTNIRSN